MLHCIDTLVGGGAERQLCYLSEALLARGHEVEVAHVGGGRSEPRLRGAGVPLHRIPATHALGQVWALRRTISDRRPDVVQSWLGRMNVIAGLATRGSSRPWIYCERSVRLHDRGLPGLVRQWLGARSELLVANSESGARLWRPLRARRIEVIPNGLPLDQIDGAPPTSRATLGVDESAELILWAGRFAPAKNLPLLAGALASVLAARPRAVALLCGDGELLSAFRDDVARRGIGARCRLPGYRSDLFGLFKSADLFVLPSLAEGQPNVVLEAMAAGCPVAVSDIAAHREIVDDTTGARFGAQSVDEAAAVITHMLADRRAARDRAAAARAAVQRRSITAMAWAWEQLYEQLLSDAGRPAGGYPPRADSRWPMKRLAIARRS